MYKSFGSLCYVKFEMLIFGIPYIYVVKSAIEMFENHRLDKVIVNLQD